MNWNDTLNIVLQSILFKGVIAMLDTNTNNMITFVLEKIHIYNLKIHLDDLNPAF